MKIYTMRILYLVLYLFIASQGMFYLIGINKALRNISISAFIEQRKAIDAVIGSPLKFLYFGSMAIAVILLALNIRSPRSITFITVGLSLLCIFADLYLALGKSIPLNQIINNYPSNNYPNIVQIRDQWLTYINCRGTIAILGLFILLSGFLVEAYGQGTGSITKPTKNSASSPGIHGSRDTLNGIPDQIQKSH